jgi:hypothetical protein
LTFTTLGAVPLAKAVALYCCVKFTHGPSQAVSSVPLIAALHVSVPPPLFVMSSKALGGYIDHR